MPWFSQRSVSGRRNVQQQSSQKDFVQRVVRSRIHRSFVPPVHTKPVKAVVRWGPQGKDKNVIREEGVTAAVRNDKTINTPVILVSVLDRHDAVVKDEARIHPTLNKKECATVDLR